MFLKNLPLDVTQEYVLGLFEEYGSIHSVHVVQNINDSNSRCAYVNFHELDSALAAVRIMNKFKCGENRVEVNVIINQKDKKRNDYRPFTDCKYSQECSPKNGKVSILCAYIEVQISYIHSYILLNIKAYT